jgi:protein-disulfide isomerase
MSRIRQWARLALLALAVHATPALAQVPAIRGAADAPVTILMFSGFACRYCAEAQVTLEQIAAEYPGKVRIVYKHFPLGADAASYLPHLAAQAAGEQGKFWEMHDALFRHQADLGDRGRIDALARALKLDMARFNAAIDQRSGGARIAADLAEAQALKVQATPTFYIDGYKFEGAQSAAVFRTMIGHALAPALPQPTMQERIDRAIRQTAPAIEAQQRKAAQQ